MPRREGKGGAETRPKQSLQAIAAKADFVEQDQSIPKEYLGAINNIGNTVLEGTVSTTSVRAAARSRSLQSCRSCVLVAAQARARAVPLRQSSCA